MNVTVKNRAVVTPVANVPVFLKFVPQVSVKLDAPEVVIEKTTICPATPPLALNVHEPVGVMVTIDVVMLTVIVPVVADVAAAADIPPLENGRTPVTLVVRSIDPANIALVTLPAPMAVTKEPVPPP